MLRDVSVDLGTVALLAVVVWLDGWRRLPTDTLLAVRMGLGPWGVRPPWARVGPFALVTSWAPVIVPALLVTSTPAITAAGSAWASDFALTAARTRRRLRRVRAVIAMLRALGVLEILLVIVGIPVATAAFGAPGLLYGILGALVLAMQMTFGTTIALRSLGDPLGRAFRTSAQLLSPFTAPRAVEIVTSAAVGPLHSLAPLAALLGEPRFLAWLRPWAYDELAGRRHGIDTESVMMPPLVAALPRTVLERAVERGAVEAGDDGAPYCPRCTRTYADIAETCGHCDEIPLVLSGRE
jgi:hypothetical protein